MSEEDCEHYWDILRSDDGEWVGRKCVRCDEERGRYDEDLTDEQRAAVKQRVMRTVLALMNDNERVQKLADSMFLIYKIWFEEGWRPIDSFETGDLIEELSKRHGDGMTVMPFVGKLTVEECKVPILILPDGDYRWTRK